MSLPAALQSCNAEAERDLENVHVMQLGGHLGNEMIELPSPGAVPS